MPSREADRRRPAASQSFTPKEVKWLKQLFAMMARNADTSNLRDSKAYRSVWKKVERMDATVERKKRELTMEPEERSN